MRGATYNKNHCGDTYVISIHAPHARSDDKDFAMLYSIYNFNPRSSCEERQDCRGNICRYIHFNPRSSCEERPQHRLILFFYSNFNPRSSCEERQASRHTESSKLIFQSTLLMRGATFVNQLRQPIDGFQSTLLMRGATQYARSRGGKRLISIHAPHARSDGAILTVLL